MTATNNAYPDIVRRFIILKSFFFHKITTFPCFYVVFVSEKHVEEEQRTKALLRRLFFSPLYKFD